MKMFYLFPIKNATEGHRDQAGVITAQSSLLSYDLGAISRQRRGYAVPIAFLAIARAEKLVRGF
jgi:hypothetical protein